MKTGKNTDSHEAQYDDWKSRSSSQQVRGKERRSGCKRKLKRKIDDLEQEHDKRSKAITCVCLSFCFL